VEYSAVPELLLIALLHRWVRQAGSEEREWRWDWSRDRTFR